MIRFFLLSLARLFKPTFLHGSDAQDGKKLMDRRSIAGNPN